MTTETKEIRLHSAISWNKSVYIQQMPASKKFATSQELINIACAVTGISRKEFEGGQRLRNCVTARMLVSNYLLKHYGYTLSRIGKICGGKDHATILHYKRNFIKFMDWNDHITIDAVKRFNEELININPNYKQL